MRNDPSQPSDYGRQALCIFLILTGLAAYGIAATIDIDYWSSQAVTDRGKLEWGGSALVFQTMTFLFAGVVAVLLRQRKFGIALLGGIVLSFYMIYGMSSIVGFGGRERISKTVSADERHKSQLDAVVTANAQSTQLRAAHIKFLQEQVAKTKRPESKQVAIDALGQATFGTIEVLPAPVKEQMADPQAEFLHMLFPSWTVESIQFASTIAFGIGLIFAKIFCFAFGVGLWPVSEPRKSKAKPEQEIIADAPETPSNIIHPPQFAKATPSPAMVADETEAEPVDPALARDVEKYVNEVDQVEEFWGSQTRVASEARISCTTMYKAYCNWAKARGHNPASSQMFGRVATRIGIERDKRKASAWAYMGRALVGESEAAPLLMVA